MSSDPVSGPVPGPGAEVLAEPLRSRWSPSYFDGHETLSRDEVTALLQAGRWSPSRGNSQPWAFLVAERGSPTRAVLDASLSRGNAWVRRAALVVVTLAQVAPDPAPGPGVEPGTKPAKDPTGAYYDTGQAAAHITVQARAAGLEAHQFAGFDHDSVAAGLGVPGHVRVLDAIAVGHRGAPGTMPQDEREREARTRERKPLDEVALTRWGEGW